MLAVCFALCSAWFPLRGQRQLLRSQPSQSHSIRQGEGHAVRQLWGPELNSKATANVRETGEGSRHSRWPCAQIKTQGSFTEEGEKSGYWVTQLSLPHLPLAEVMWGGFVTQGIMFRISVLLARFVLKRRLVQVKSTSSVFRLGNRPREVSPVG